SSDALDRGPARWLPIREDAGVGVEQVDILGSDPDERARELAVRRDVSPAWPAQHRVGADRDVILQQRGRDCSVTTEVAREEMRGACWIAAKAGCDAHQTLLAT